MTFQRVKKKRSNTRQWAWLMMAVLCSCGNFVASAEDKNPAATTPQTESASAATPVKLPAPAPFVTHVAKATDITSNWTKTAVSSGDPNAILIATPNWSEGASVYLTAPIGVFYTAGSWAVFMQDRSAMPVGAAFNIRSFAPGPRAWVHRATEENTDGFATTLSQPVLNDWKESADPIILLTQVWNPGGEGGVYNSRPVGVEKTADDKWRIINLDGSAMPAGAAFNVAVVPGQRHVASGDNTIGHISKLSSFTARDQKILATPVRTAGSAPRDTSVGVYHHGTSWTVFNQDKTAIAPGTIFNVYAGQEDRTSSTRLNPNATSVLLAAPLLTTPLAVATPTPTPEPTPVQRYRVVLTGFTVNRETWDDALERDGKRDEVYIASQWVKLSKSSDPARARVLADSGAIRSVVYGDITNKVGRIAAGSAQPGFFTPGEVGGLMTGDNYPEVPWRLRGTPSERRIPMILWEGDFSYTDSQPAVVVMPTVWEWDGPDDWLTSLGRVAQSVPFVNLPFLVGGEVDRFFSGDGWRGEGGSTVDELRERVLKPIDAPWAIGRNIRVSQDVLGDPHDRPIGMSDEAGAQSTFKPWGIFLNDDIARWISDTDFGNGKGMLRIRYQDSERLKGDYSLFVLVEKTS